MGTTELLWPDTTKTSADGALVIGGVGIPELAATYGTPLYVFDEQTLRSRARTIVEAAQSVYPRGRAVFAAKALALPAILRLLHDEGLGVDVVSGGELFAAIASGIPPGAITMHGNNKSRTELAEAIDSGIEFIAVDNLHELDLLSELIAGRSAKTRILLRLNPGIDVHTHGKIATGVVDSKFGFPLWTSDAADAVERALETPGLEFAGYHAHLGSQLFDVSAPVLAIRMILQFAATMRDRFGIVPVVISPGGGMGIAYDNATSEVEPEGWFRETAAAVLETCKEVGLLLPELVFEPGRSIVGPAGVAVYEVGSRKEIEGVRTYVSVDGGMADNIRPALYDAVYSAQLANRTATGKTEVVSIAGRYCESGDVLIRDIRLPSLAPGDLLAIPAAGAYCIPMASNYNMSPRPAMVMVKSGRSVLLRRRETYADLLALDEVDAAFRIYGNHNG